MYNIYIIYNTLYIVYPDPLCVYHHATWDGDEVDERIVWYFQPRTKIVKPWKSTLEVTHAPRPHYSTASCQGYPCLMLTPKPTLRILALQLVPHIVTPGKYWDSKPSAILIQSSLWVYDKPTGDSSVSAWKTHVFTEPKPISLYLKGT